MDHIDAIRVDNSGPTLSSRNLAVLHTAIYDSVNSIDNFVPEIGRTFQILRGQTRTGEFRTINGRSIDATRHFEIRYTQNAVELQVVAGP